MHWMVLSSRTTEAQCRCPCSPTPLHVQMASSHLKSQPRSNYLGGCSPMHKAEPTQPRALESSLDFSTMRAIQKDDWNLPGVKRKVNDERSLEGHTPKY